MRHNRPKDLICDETVSDSAPSYYGYRHSAAPRVDGDRFYVCLLNPDCQSDSGAYQTLRHSYFVCERGWVSPDLASPGLEFDCYDLHCFHLAVFDPAQENASEVPIAAYLRVLPWKPAVGFMLDHEFSCLLPNPNQSQIITAVNSVELSRLVVAPHIKAQGGAAIRQVVELLLKLLYRLSLQENWSTYYIVVEEAWLKTFIRRFHLPFTPLGQPHTFPDGTRTLAAVAYREEMERAIKLHDPAKYRWYTGQE